MICKNSIGKLLLLVFWCVTITSTIPSLPGASQECACPPQACACSHNASCHGETTNRSVANNKQILLPADCQSKRPPGTAGRVFEAYPPPSTYKMRVFGQNSPFTPLRDKLLSGIIISPLLRPPQA